MSARVNPISPPILIHVLVTALVASVLVACGGAGSDTTLSLTANIDGLEPGTDTEATLDETAFKLQQRVAGFGSGGIDITVDGTALAVSVSGMDEAIARRLLIPQGLLEFRQPVISESGLVLCIDADGDEFEVHPLRVNPDDATQNPARCFGNNQVGDPKWEATATAQVRTEERSLADLIEPAGWQIRNETTLAPQFDADGSDLLAEVTQGLVGYPLGIFVDDELIGAPRIQRAITNGNPVISGFEPTEARIRQAQLNAGPLPVTLAEANPE